MRTKIWLEKSPESDNEAARRQWRERTPTFFLYFLISFLIICLLMKYYIYFVVENKGGPKLIFKDLCVDFGDNYADVINSVY